MLLARACGSGGRAISASNAGARWRLDEPAELAFVLRGAEPAPVADHVQVGALTKAARARGWRRVRRKASVEWHDAARRLAEVRVMRFGGFGADTAPAHRFTWRAKQGPRPLLQPQRFPAQRMPDAS